MKMRSSALRNFCERFFISFLAHSAGTDTKNSNYGNSRKLDKYFMLSVFDTLQVSHKKNILEFKIICYER